VILTFYEKRFKEVVMAHQSQTGLRRAHVFISGRVQGVSFRWYTVHMAQNLGLTGWVRNMHDGRVEAVFEGPEEAVRQAVTWCHHGERPARVEDVDVSYETPTGEFKSFRVTY
jgi:acylphosphatase